jgi:hypothetical protein
MNKKIDQTSFNWMLISAELLWNKGQCIDAWYTLFEREYILGSR